MTRFVPAHQHAFVSFLVFAFVVAFVGYVVWTAVHRADAPAVIDAGP